MSDSPALCRLNFTTIQEIFRRSRKILLTPFFWSDAKTFFKQGVKKTDVTIAGIIGDAPDFDVGIQEQLAGTLQA